MINKRIFSHPWKLLLFNLCIASIPISTNATVRVNGIRYNLNSDNTAEVTYEQKASDLNYTDYGKKPLVIPEEITYGNETYTVTSIDEYAFYCARISSIEIPGTVKKIGTKAFNACRNVSSITIEDGVTEIGLQAFYGCSGLDELNIPNSVISIGASAFMSCGIRTLTIGESVISIGTNAFANSNITTVTIPNSTTELGSGVFSGCSTLELANIGTGISSIPDQTFYNCARLSNFSFPETITAIGKEAFYGCTGLETITIPNTITTIGNNAFSGAKLKKVYCDNTSPAAAGSNAFSGAEILYLPYEKEDEYIANGWKSFSEYRTAPITCKYFGGGVALWEDKLLNRSADELWGDNVAINLTPDDGYKVKKAVLNGDDITSIFIYENKLVITERPFWNTLEIYFDDNNVSFDPQKTASLKVLSPGQHSVNIKCLEGQSTEIHLSPCEGWNLYSVSFNGENINIENTQEDGSGYITTPPLTGENEIIAIYTQSPVTGVDNIYQDSIRIKINGNCIIAENKDTADRMTIYRPDGFIIGTTYANHYNVPSSNKIVVVSIGNQLFKVALK